MLFAVKLFDRDDPGGALRDANRADHLDYLSSFEDRTLFAGPILTGDRSKELGSHRLCASPTCEAPVFLTNTILVQRQK